MSRFHDWLDGDLGPSLHTQRRNPSPSRPKTEKKERLSDRKKLTVFLKRYRPAVILGAVVFAVIFLLAVLNLPSFGSPDNPTNNEVVQRYVGSAEEETGAENVIAGMILNYRGFDTFGESCVLFLAACCVMMLLGRDRHTFSAADAEAAEKEEAAEKQDIILNTVSKMLIPCVLCFGICVLFNGHVSPGGGFSGGSVLGASMILFSVAFGRKSTARFMSARIYNIIRISGLCIYGVMFGIYIFFGANAIESDLSRYIVSVIDIAVGLVVMTTMYGFYSFYTRGEL